MEAKHVITDKPLSQQQQQQQQQKEEEEEETYSSPSSSSNHEATQQHGSKTITSEPRDKEAQTDAHSTLTTESDIPPPPDGGLHAWLKVFGGFMIYINIWFVKYPSHQPSIQVYSN
jgi:hypothetical protein